MSELIFITYYFFNFKLLKILECKEITNLLNLNNIYVVLNKDQKQVLLNFEH